MNWEQFCSYSDEKLAQIDPVVMNLEIAKGIPALASLEVARYQ